MYGSIPIIVMVKTVWTVLKKIKKFPLLTLEEEKTSKSLMLMVTLKRHMASDSHLRLVAKISMGYKGYGLPLSDIIAEEYWFDAGSKRFDPDRGFRLATYAIWWIKAAIQEYVLRSWSLVKMGTTANQKKLFFNLRKIKNNIKP